MSLIPDWEYRAVYGAARYYDLEGEFELPHSKAEIRYSSGSMGIMGIRCARRNLT